MIWIELAVLTALFVWFSFSGDAYVIVKKMFPAVQFFA